MGRRDPFRPLPRAMRYTVRKVGGAAAVAILIALLVVADRLGVFGRAPRPDVEKYHNRSFTVVHVVDGDTLDVNCPDGHWPHTRIRLWGVDTPETVKPESPVEHFGPEATAFTRQAAAGKIVTLELEPRHTRDKHDRLLAYVFLPDGRMLNRLLVQEGYGYADPRFGHRHKDEFARLQRHAMRERRGLWRSVRREDLPYYYHDTLKLPEAATTTSAPTP